MTFDPHKTCGKPCDCPSYRDHLLSVGVSAAATPSRNRTTSDAIAREKRWDRDMPAYKRLREEGLQPKSIDGAGDLETRANDKLEIEGGAVIAGGHLKVVKEIREITSESKVQS